MLDAARRDKSVSIKDLVLSSPAKEGKLPFDPDIGISSQDWLYMKLNYLEKITGSFDERQEAILTGQYLNYLFPNKRAELVMDNLWEQSAIFAQNYPYEGDRSSIKPLAEFAGIKVLFPDQFPSLEFPRHTVEVTKQIEPSEKIQNSKGRSAISRRFYNLFGLGILDYKDTVEKVLPQLDPPTTENLEIFFNPFYALDPHAVIGLKAFYPDIFNRAKYLIDWDELRSNLGKSSKNGFWFDVIPLASAMTIMAAEEVRIDESGLTINLRRPPSLVTPDQRLPERRRF